MTANILLRLDVDLQIHWYVIHGEIMNGSGIEFLSKVAEWVRISYIVDEFASSLFGCDDCLWTSILTSHDGPDGISFVL